MARLRDGSRPHRTAATRSRQRPAPRRTTAAAATRPYWLYLLPGAVLFVLVIGVPLVVQRLPVADQVVRRRRPRVRRPRQLPATCCSDDVFWTSFKNTVAMIVAMVVVPTLLGLVLAAVLFDVIGRRFQPRTASAPAGRLLPAAGAAVVVAGIVWGWILRPDGALNSLLDAIGLGALRHDWLGDPNTALPRSWW